LTQIRQRHLHGSDKGMSMIYCRRRVVAFGGTMGALDNRVDLVIVADAAKLDGALHARHGMFGQELQNADELPGAGRGTVLSFQTGSQLGEHRRQLPVAIDVGVVQGRRFAAQHHQIMQRIQHLHALFVTTWMTGDDLVAGHDLDVLHVTLHGHRGERVGPWHAVGVVIEAHRLILVHRGRLHDAGIERSGRQWHGRSPVALEALADRLCLARLRTLAVAQAAGTEMAVQLLQVLHLRHGRGPVLLQELHAPFDARLLLRSSHQAEARLEIVMAGQGDVALVELPAAALEKMRRHGLGIVPPHFARHAAKESKRLGHAVQNRLGSLGRQGDREGTVGVRPGHDQHRHLLPPLGQVDVDVAEVGFQALTRILIEWNERLTQMPPTLAHIEPNALIAAREAVLLL
jgi:hypothetical protein